MVIKINKKNFVYWMILLKVVSKCFSLKRKDIHRKMKKNKMQTIDFKVVSCLKCDKMINIIVTQCLFKFNLQLSPSVSQLNNF